MYDNLTAANLALLTTVRLGLPKSHRIIEEVCRERDVPVEDILGDSRLRTITRARQECYHRIRRDTDLSLAQIGRIFKRDHTTIIHGISQASKRELAG